MVEQLSLIEVVKLVGCFCLFADFLHEGKYAGWVDDVAAYLA